MKPRAASRAATVGILILVLAALFSTAALGEEKSRWEKFRGNFSDEKEVPPEDELFAEAEAYFYGRETWFGRLVKKTRGEDSKAYQEWRGIKRKNMSRAQELYQMFADNYRFSARAPIAELRSADCAFHLDNYEEASILYRQFRLLHPRRPEAPYALFMEANCHYERMLKPGRDQTETQKAAALYQELLKSHPGSPHEEEARTKLDECRTRLAEHEFIVADFYFKRKEYWAAAARYRGVQKNYSDLGFGDKAMFQEAACYEALGKTEMARALYDKTAASFPESDHGKKAREKVDQLRQ